uniref:Activin_recp domain-containing protein n=1 Tax=Rhabditophanes sp. KR3021 TaxID=114890 RepID=A0AC35U6Z8_9BILA
MQYFNLIFLINGYIVLTQALECYFGRSNLTSKDLTPQTCVSVGNGVIVEYCAKLNVGGDTIRECDALNQCATLGATCRVNLIYSGLHGELCCCKGDRCNGGASIKSNYQGTFFILTLVTTLASYYFIGVTFI